MTVGVSTALVANPRYQFMITAGILAAAAADILLVELEDGWRYAIYLQARKTARDSVRRVFRMLSCHWQRKITKQFYSRYNSMICRCDQDANKPHRCVWSLCLTLNWLSVLMVYDIGDWFLQVWSILGFVEGAVLRNFPLKSPLSQVAICGILVWFFSKHVFQSNLRYVIAFNNF